MKLDRNIPSRDGRGKYALMNLRALDAHESRVVIGHEFSDPITDAIKLLTTKGFLEWGNVGSEHEFFVVKMKDRHAYDALAAYATSLEENGGDLEFAQEVREMLPRAGTNSEFCKEPD